MRESSGRVHLQQGRAGKGREFTTWGSWSNKRYTHKGWFAGMIHFFFKSSRGFFFGRPSTGVDRGWMGDSFILLHPALR